MKLNYKRTVLAGFAFLSISAFWQMYNNVIPLILSNTFNMSETVTGAVMAADNVLALFLLPFFGALSDKSKSRLGKRRPYIIFGTIGAVILMNILPLLDNSYFVVPTQAKLIGFVVVLMLLLITMGTYRSPSVALMPDITPKPLRSKGNAIINLMGSLGAIIYLGVAGILYSSDRTAGLEHIDYGLLFMIVSGIMIVGVIIVSATIHERKIEAEIKEYDAAHPEDNLAVTDESSGKEVLPPEVKRSLAFLLVSIFLWFIGYNSVITWFTTYAGRTWDMALGEASTCQLVAYGGALVAFIPIGIISSKVGRKKAILTGVTLLALGYLSGYIISVTFDSFTPLLYIVFLIIGIAWASINVNSLPMVVEMCSGSDIGRFTGFYYTFSMAAQIVSPVISGALLNNVGYNTLFPFAAAFVVFSFITMLFVKHGDNKITA